MRFKAYSLSLVFCCSVCAAVESTVDEWAERFAPEITPKPELPAYADAYDRTAADVSAGRYRAAICDLATVEKPNAALSDLLRARALIGLGETDDALKLLAGPTLAKSADAEVVAAKVLLRLNRLVESEKIVDRILAADTSNLAGRLLKAQLLEARGDFPAAITAYDWFIDGPTPFLQKWQTDPSQFENADDIVAFATAIHRWATLTSAYKDVQQLNDTVLNMFIRAFDVVDRDSVTARVAAAEFALSRGDREHAEQFAGPLGRLAPLDRDVLLLQLEAAVSSHDPSSIQSAVDAVRRVDPDSVEADIAEARGLARARPVAAEDRAALLYSKYPDRLDVIGLYAACEFITRAGDVIAPLMTKADALSPHRSDAEVMAAETLVGAVAAEPAIKLLQTAIARTPWENEPRHVLGYLYLNDGYNEQARAVLDEAFKADPYNIATVNFLRLLDELDQYARRVSEHMVVYYDKDADPIVADQIGPFLERTYDDLKRIFKFEPKTKLVIQIYPNDDEFSVRMAGVPGVENFGVSFGRVLATIAPRKGTKQGNFNYARVLRHELVHTFNILAADGRCPRWFTEGLAVWQEGVPFRFASVPRELYQRAMDNDLYTIRGLPLSYIVPHKGNNEDQSYTQAAYLVRYVVERYGPDSIVKILTAYAEAKSDEQAFLAGTGDTTATIEAGYFAWMKQKLAPWHYDAATDKKVAALEAEGEQFIKAHKLAEAVTAWQQACDLQPTEVRPHQRLAFLYLQKDLSDPAKAIEHLKFLHMLELQNDRFAKQISRLYTKLGDAQNAVQWAREANYVDLYDPAAHDLLAELFAKQGDDKQAAAETQTVEQIKLWQQKQTPAAAPPPPAN